MRLLDKIKSEKDDVTKYVFQMFGGLITEFSYINKGDGKDIICVSTQTLCAQGCKFCHVSDHVGKLKLRNITADEIYAGVVAIINDLDLFPMLSTHRKRTKRNCLLISYMGCGEPLASLKGVKGSIESIEDRYFNLFETVRFAVATMIPVRHLDAFYDFASWVRKYKYNVKIHLSLHYTDDKVRSEWMPNAMPIRQSIDSLVWATEQCNIKGEVHYALIEGVNDSCSDAHALRELLEGSKINVKFLYYNEKDSVEARASSEATYEMLAGEMGAFIPTEYYIPPGLDVGASCGQFLLDYYEKYNGVKNE